MEAKYALYNFAGEPVAYGFAQTLETPEPVIEKKVGHHIVIIDRSGSMYSVMDETKAMVEKVMTVEEFHNSELLLTLISYSSSGDCTLHFARTPVRYVLDPNQSLVSSIRSIRASCLTSASQALGMALTHIGNETTAISLHTDGWFNDRSPAAEKKAIDTLLTSLGGLPNVLVNTIAYSNYSDFNYLSSIANRMSGPAVLATNVKEVYNALHDTTKLVQSGMTPVIRLQAKSPHAYLVAHFEGTSKVVGSTYELAIRGVQATDKVTVWAFTPTTKDQYEHSALPDLDRTAEGRTALYAYARTKLADGRINEAKYAISTLRSAYFLGYHANALSSDRLAKFAQDLDVRLADETRWPKTNTTFGVASEQASLVELFAVLNANRTDYQLDLFALEEVYTRRSVTRLNGRWVEGAFVKNDCELVDDEPISSENRWVSVLKIDANVAEATINLTTERPGRLMKGGKKVRMVAGQNLATFPIIRSYTIVADGAPAVPSIYVTISNKALFNKLRDLHFIPSEGTYSHAERYEVNLTRAPVVPYDQSRLVPFKPEVLADYAQLLVERKLLEACIPATAGKGQEWTPEQLEELKAHGLTANLSFSAPSTNPYSDLEAAASAGEIDSYTRYTVSFGAAAATDLRTALWSANEYLARRFSVKCKTASDTDKEGYLKKPKIADLAGADEIKVKELSARTKLTPLDAIVMPVYEKFVGNKKYTDSVEFIRDRLGIVNDRIEEIEDHMSSLALSLGSTGIIPEHWNYSSYNAEQLAEKYPGIDVPKAHAEGTFFEVDGAIFGIHPIVAWYSTELGVEKAKQLEG